MKPLVSIIVPVYNIERYIKKCLESLCRQSYSNIEIIIVDDGSTDSSGEICDGFAVGDARVKVFHKKNGGLSSARNYGILKAKGEYIALVDGDDFVKKDFIEAMVKKAKEKDADLVICGFNDIVPKEELLSGEDAAARLLTSQDNLEIVAWNKLYKKELFKDIRYPEGKKYEDSLTTYKILAEAKNVVYMPKSLYCYVSRPGSIMDASKRLERLIARREAADEARDYFKNNKKLQQAAEIAVLTSKYAFMDAAIKKEVDWNYFVLNSEWIKKHKKQFEKNKFMTKKLKLYNFLNSAGFYKLFRTIV